MKVLVTGATGFTGSAVIPLLLQKGVEVRCLVRRSSDLRFIDSDRVELVCGELDNEESVRRALRNVDILINIASLGFGHAPAIVRSAQAERVARCIFISTTAVFTNLIAPSKAVRLAAEELICKSNLNYSILRPTMIYGSSRDRNMCRLINFLRRSPAIPIFGSGEFLQQPVYVEDLAAAIVAAAFSERAVRNCYNVSGAKPLTYNQIIDEVTSQLDRRVWRIHLPASPCVKVLRTFERLSIALPIRSEQLLRLNEHKAFPWDDAARDLGYNPRTFAEGIKEQLADRARERSRHTVLQSAR